MVRRLSQMFVVWACNIEAEGKVLYLAVVDNPQHGAVSE